MKRFLTLCVLLLQVLFFSKAAADPVVAGYYENWSQYRPATGGRATFFPNLIDPSIMTDVYFAFAYFGFVTKSIDPDNPHLTGDYTVQPVEWNDQSVLYPQIQALKQINPKLRTHLSIGGWGFNDPNDPNGAGQYTYKLFSEMAASPSGREQFIASAIEYAQKYGFDGIDLDWEYPGDLTRGGSEDDFANFVELLKELQASCQAANPPLLVSYASAAIVPTGVSQKYHDNPSLYFQWLAECAEHLDHVNVMCYDYHGAFDNPKLTGVNAPLNHDTNPDSTMYVAKTIENYLSGGVPANKIVMGMPTYGHSFGGVTGMTDEDYAPGKPFTQAGAAGPSTGSPGLLAYFEISDMIANKELTFGTDSTTSTAVAYNTATGEWVSFDTPDTIALKTDLVKEKDLLGAMFWAIDDDEYQWGDKYPNIRKAYDMLYPSKDDLGMSLESLHIETSAFSSKRAWQFSQSSENAIEDSMLSLHENSQASLDSLPLEKEMRKEVRADSFDSSLISLSSSTKGEKTRRKKSCKWKRSQAIKKAFSSKKARSVTVPSLLLKEEESCKGSCEDCRIGNPCTCKKENCKCEKEISETELLFDRLAQEISSLLEANSFLHEECEEETELLDSEETRSSSFEEISRSDILEEKLHSQSHIS